MKNYLLALSLLTGDVDPEPHYAAAPTLQRLSLQWEILDIRETRYVCTRREEFVSDVSVLRRRYSDLIDAPFVVEAERFPSRESIQDVLSLNREFRRCIDDRLNVEFVRPWVLEETLRETDRLYSLWDTIRDARCEYYYVTVRRAALKKVRDDIGPEAYYAGRYPPGVPLWRFKRID